MTRLLIALGLLAPVVACHSPALDARLAYDRGRRDQSQVSARRWAYTVPACAADAADAPDDSVLRGRLVLTGTQAMGTLVECPPKVHCCNSASFDGVLLVQRHLPYGDDRKRVLVEFEKDVPWVPPVVGTGALECEWSEWGRVVSQVELRAKGHWGEPSEVARGSATTPRVFHVESMCRVRFIGQSI